MQLAFTISTFLLSIILFAIVFVPLAVVAYLLTRQRKETAEARRSPLSEKLLRNPGESLQREIEKNDDAISEYLLHLIAIPGVTFAVGLTTLFYDGRAVFTPAIFIVVTTVTCVTAFSGRNLLKVAAQRHRNLIGYQAELAIGQNLNYLMRSGAVAFHDFPADDFNIDHVLVTDFCVLAIETKGRTKPNRNLGSEDSRVEVEADYLKFPDFIDRAAIPQARRQSEWLANWISGVVGEAVPVVPVVALPGWYISRKVRSDIEFINGKDLDGLLKIRGKSELSDSCRRRIIYQLDQRCRTVEPRNFRTHLRKDEPAGRFTS